MQDTSSVESRGREGTQLQKGTIMNIPLSGSSYSLPVIMKGCFTFTRMILYASSTKMDRHTLPISFLSTKPNHLQYSMNMKSTNSAHKSIFFINSFFFSVLHETVRP